MFDFFLKLIDVTENSVLVFFIVPILPYFLIWMLHRNKPPRFVVLLFSFWFTVLFCNRLTHFYLYNFYNEIMFTYWIRLGKLFVVNCVMALISCIKIVDKNLPVGKNKHNFYLFISIYLVISFFLGNRFFSCFSFDEMIFLVFSSIEGADFSYLTSFFVNVILNAFLICSFPYFLLLNVSKKIQKYISFFSCLYVFYIIIVLIFSLILFFVKEHKLGDFYEKYYVQPNEQIFKFPSQKRNLIFILFESMETGFFSEADGGTYKEDLLPELKQLMDENISFTPIPSTINGRIQIYGTETTKTSINAVIFGIPTAPSYANIPDIPGAISLFDILCKDNNYSCAWILGSRKQFTGKDKLAERHGNIKMLDYVYYLDNNILPRNHLENWGFGDRKLYELSKKYLENEHLERPFFLFIETLDLHGPEPFIDSLRIKKYKDRTKDMVANASEMLYDFLKWCREQEWYSNTTIVVYGDHLERGNFISKKNKEQEERRHAIDFFENSLLNSNFSKVRKFTTMDFFPTILHSIGVDWGQNALGLGRALDGTDPTLIEIFEIDSLNTYLRQRNNLYMSLFR